MKIIKLKNLRDQVLWINLLNLTSVNETSDGGVIVCLTDGRSHTIEKEAAQELIEELELQRI